MRPTTAAQIASSSSVSLLILFFLSASTECSAVRSSRSVHWNEIQKHMNSFSCYGRLQTTNRSLYWTELLWLKRIIYTKRKEKHKTTHWIACSIFFACSIQVEINKWCFRVCVHCHLAAWQKTPWVGCCADHLNHVQRIIFCFDFVSVLLAVYSVFYVIYLVYYMHWSALGFVGLKPLRFALWREWKKKQ